MKVYLNARIPYLIHKTGVEDLCIARDFLRGDIFVRGDSFLGRGDRLENFFFKE